MAKQFAVLGLGTFGQKIATTLMQEGAEVIAVDRDGALVDTIKDQVSTAVVLDCTSEEALRSAGIHEVDFALVCMGDMEASILTTLLLKNVGVVKVIARANSQPHAQILEATQLLASRNLTRRQKVRSRSARERADATAPS